MSIVGHFLNEWHTRETLPRVVGEVEIKEKTLKGKGRGGHEVESGEDRK